jgi:DNA-binding NtrC family response regulator
MAMIKGTLLIVDQNRNDQDSLRRMLQNEMGNIIFLTSPDRINETLERNVVDIVLLEMNFKADVHSGNEGFYWMKEISNYDNTISVIMITSTGDVELAVKAIREGAADFILKPWDQNKLLAAVNIAWTLRISRQETLTLKNDNQYLKKEINKVSEKFVQGASPTMINVLNIVRKVAATDANVLITGENGTGKELVAREIHNLSNRSGELMVSVDIGSVTESLFESELFGHVKGAFTDARDDHKGKFEIAHNGTLFLDEIGNLSLQSQVKLLRVLQNRYIVRVGSNKPIPVDIRLICATNCDLQQMVREGKFREDLIYRINTILIEVPPLRDRVDDIPILANYFLKVYGRRYGKNDMKINTHALEKLANHHWPGNVRELQHSIEKAVIMGDSPVLKPSDFVLGSSPRNVLHSEITLEEMEKKMISEALKRHNNNLSVVSNKLGITRQTLYNKIRKYNI